MKRKMMVTMVLTVAMMVMLCIGASAAVELVGADFGADTIDAGDYKVSITLNNDGAAIEDATLIMTSFEGGRLKDVSYEGGVSIAAGECTITSQNAVTVTTKENSEVKAMLWNDFEPVIVPQTLNSESRSLDFKFKVNNDLCDINTAANRIYVLTSDGNATEAVAQSEGAEISVLNAAEEGVISSGDTYKVSAQNDSVPAKTFTVVIEKAPTINYVTNFDNGMNGNNPVIGTGDNGRFDNSFAPTIIDNNGNNVLCIDGTSAVTCNLNRYWYADPKDKYTIEYKFNLLESNGHYLFHCYLFNTRNNGAGNYAGYKITTWDNSKSDEYKNLYVEPGNVMFTTSSNFSNEGKIAIVPTASWHTFKAVLRKASDTTTSIEYYIDGKFGNSEILNFSLSDKCAGAQDRFLQLEDYSAGSTEFKLLLDDMAFRW